MRPDRWGRVTSLPPERGSPGGLRAREYLALPRRRNVWEVLAVNTFRLLGQVLRLLARHPRATATAVMFLTVLHFLGVIGIGFLLIGLMAMLGVWRWRWPGSCARVITEPLRGQWRRLICYQRHWQPAMAMCGLAGEYGERQYLPVIKRVLSNKFADRVLVVLLAGQSPDDFEQETNALAHTFGVQRCAVRVDRPGRVWLDMFRTNALTETLPALPVPDEPDFTALELGRTETGIAWTLSLTGTHVLIAGATGSGKGSVLWSIVRALANGVRMRKVLLWGIDPKGGMELTFGARMFDRLAYEDPAGMLKLLVDAVELMRDRQHRYSGITRNFNSTVNDPLVVVIIDELAALIAYYGDAETKQKIHSLLQLLLSQGRAVGLVVIGALQDPGKDIIPFRDGFPTRIGLRLIEAVQVDMVLGDGARKRGAVCDRIPSTQPGVGYVVQEGVREPVRVRTAYVTDRDLFDMSARYAPGKSEEPPSEISQNKSHESEHDEVRPYLRSCAQCGGPLAEGTRRGAKYCSARCRQAWHRSPHE